ncbi:unnamed protein product [Albugo candida]|uniref:Uncharacterized protein n=1 Tax=Albugo candida TaxID=65357 RepID=A0A024GTV0_9STRA|nr:unnamed protein product [Albugo candida]|eukprot:CCI49981.1 unnamed protein product [Albugo candida]
MNISVLYQSEVPWSKSSGSKTKILQHQSKRCPRITNCRNPLTSNMLLSWSNRKEDYVRQKELFSNWNCPVTVQLQLLIAFNIYGCDFLLFQKLDKADLKVSTERKTFCPRVKWQIRP